MGNQKKFLTFSHTSLFKLKRIGLDRPVLVQTVKSLLQLSVCIPVISFKVENKTSVKQDMLDCSIMGILTAEDAITN